MIVAIIGIIVIAGSMVYYFVFFRAEKERAEIKLQEEKFDYEKEQKAIEQTKIEQEKKAKEQEELNNKTMLVNALAELEKWYNDSNQQAYDNYLKAWDSECKRLGYKPGSALPKDIANDLDKDYENALDRIATDYQNQKDSIYKLYD